MQEDWSVHLLPHYRRRDGGVYFLVEPAPVLQLDEAEREAFDRIAATPVLVRDLDAGAVRLAERMCASGIAIACPPPRAVEGPHLLVIEPHMDDAVLATGGQLLRRTSTRPVTVLTVTRWSDYTKLAPLGDPSLDQAAVSAVRLAESALAARFVGFRHEVMDELDFPVRMRAEQKIEAGRPIAAIREAWKRFAPSPSEIAALAARIRARVEAIGPDELWIPLGVGENPDHVLTAAACLKMLGEAPTFFARRSVCLYEDLAPIPAFAGHVERILAVHRRSGALQEIEEDVTSVFPDRLRAMSLYASQVDMLPGSRPLANMGSLITASATVRPDLDRRVERRHQVLQCPRLPAPTEIALRPLELVAATVALAPWIRRRVDVRRLVVCNEGSFGKWQRGVEVLTDVFPNAAIEVYATPDHVWETSTASVPALTVRSAPAADFEALLEANAADALVLLVGAHAAAREPGARRVHVATFGDAITALCQLVARP